MKNHKEFKRNNQSILSPPQKKKKKKKTKILIAFDCIISDMLSNKKFNRTVTELFLRCRKLNISIVFITQSDFAVPKCVTLNSTHYFTMKITNKEERQQIASHDSSDIEF